MGKKSNQKKHRVAGKPVKNVSKPQMSSVERPSILGGKVAEPVAKTVRQPTGKISLMDHMDYVRSDIVHIAWLLLVVALLLIFFVLLNDKTTLLHTAGKHFASFLRLQNS